MGVDSLHALMTLTDQSIVVSVAANLAGPACLRVTLQNHSSVLGRDPCQVQPVCSERGSLDSAVYNIVVRLVQGRDPGAHYIATRIHAGNEAFPRQRVGTDSGTTQLAHEVWPFLCPSR